MDRVRHSMACFAFALWGLSQTVMAATPCASRYPPPTTLAAMFDMAQATADRLDAIDGAQVVVLARGGQDLSRYGLRHSHLGFALRDNDGRWSVRHLLNRCQSASSQLYREGLSNFIGESATHSDLRLGVPSAAVQSQLGLLLAGDGLPAKALHESRYSMVAYPFALAYQNSNQWVLEVLAAAIAASEDATDTVTDRAQAQAWLQHAGYRPSRLHIGLARRVGARFAAPHVAVTDHPLRERVSGRYSVVTVESVFEFLDGREALLHDLALPAPIPGGLTP